MVSRNSGTSCNSTGDIRKNLLRTDNGRFFAAVNRLYICIGFVIKIHDARQKGHGARPMRGGKRGTRICLNFFSCLKICLSVSSCLNFCLSCSFCLKFKQISISA